MSDIRVVRDYPHSPSKVWRALTEAEHLAAWFPTTIEGELTVGEPLIFSFDKVALAPMSGKVLACEPPKLLEFTWADETLRFELAAHESGTMLGFTATFADVGKAARDCAGWHVSLDKLPAALDGSTVSWSEDDRWRAIHPYYVATFGPEASTEGPPQEWEDVYGPA
jgi:uncharacterized protein YndB with AHSA1/START domain